MMLHLIPCSGCSSSFIGRWSHEVGSEFRALCMATHDFPGSWLQDW
jgi:hypothetical protein